MVSRAQRNDGHYADDLSVVLGEMRLLDVKITGEPISVLPALRRLTRCAASTVDSTVKLERNSEPSTSVQGEISPDYRRYEF